MPSGYTAALYEGEQTFNDFVLQSARGMGAAILMRDLDMNVPITLDQIQETDTYNTEDLDTARTDLVQAQALTDEEAAAESQARYKEEVIAHKESEAKRRALLDRYDLMLRRVQDWDPPTPDHEGLKKLMIEQLSQSIQFDCGASSWKPTEPVSGPEYREKRIAHYASEIAYHERQIAEKATRNAGRVEWTVALFESLGVEVRAHSHPHCGG